MLAIVVTSIHKRCDQIVCCMPGNYSCKHGRSFLSVWVSVL